jgi:hypothetical protein
MLSALPALRGYRGGQRAQHDMSVSSLAIGQEMLRSHLV